jgi:hypothetical protein
LVVLLSSQNHLLQQKTLHAPISADSAGAFGKERQ